MFKKGYKTGGSLQADEDERTDTKFIKKGFKSKKKGKSAPPFAKKSAK